MTLRPTTVTIIGQPFAVEYTSTATDHPLSTEGAFGKTEVAKQTLYVRDDLTIDQERDTLLHEILHATAIVLGREAELPESMVSLLAPTLLDVLRRNVPLVRYLMAA